jgi:hypothetical protein
MKKYLLFAIIIIISSVSLKSQINGVLIGDTNNIKIIKVWGTHYQRGYAYGSLLGENVTQVFNNYLKPQFGSYYSYAREMVQTGEDLYFDSSFEEEAQAIIAGMEAEGTNTTSMDYIDLLVCNSFLDISKLMSKSMGMGCSSLISWDEATAGTDLDGKSVISRHLDWQVNSNLINNQIICISLPSEDDEQPWVNVGFAGMFSVLSGFNQNVGVFQHMMDDFSGSSLHGKQYEPIWLSLRNSIEKLDYNQDGLNNVQDVRSSLMDQSEGFADGYLISAIAKSNEIQDSLIAMIAEVAPTSPYLTFRYNTYADSIPGDNIFTANYQVGREDAMHFCSRYDAIVEAIGNGTNISSSDNWELMRDYSHLNHNLQFMQYAPEMDLFQISVYNNGNHAYENEPVVFSLADLFSVYVGIDKIKGSEANISFYPNPVVDVLVINGLDEIDTPVSISVHDVNGRQLFLETKSELNVNLQLNMQSYPRGIYIVKVRSQEINTTIKVSKQ